MAGKRLPRAIGFCAALYSIGLPPELLGLSSLRPSEVKTILEFYPNFTEDLKEALNYFDPESLKMIPPSLADDIKKSIRLVGERVELNPIHQSLTRALRKSLEKKETDNIPELITQAARERKFLG